MIFLIISFIFLMIMSFEPEDDFIDNIMNTIFSMKFFIIYSLYILYVFSLYKEHNVFSYEKQITENKEVIYSLKNSEGVSGSFFLGSGNIDSVSKYTYFIKNKDESKEKKSIESEGTKIYEDEEYEPYIKIKECKSGYEFSFIKGWWSEKEACDFYKIREIHVPKNTIIMEYKI